MVIADIVLINSYSSCKLCTTFNYNKSDSLGLEPSPTSIGKRKNITQYAYFNLLFEGIFGRENLGKQNYAALHNMKAKRPFMTMMTEVIKQFYVVTRRY